MSLTPPYDRSMDSVGERKRRRPWRDKFREAFRGMKLGVRGHSSFFVHFFAAALVILAAVTFQCNRLEWCILLGCIGAVFAVELLNSAIETLARTLEPPARDHVKPCLDIAAGAVLLTSMFAAAIGGVIFVGRLMDALG